MGTKLTPPPTPYVTTRLQVLWLALANAPEAVYGGPPPTRRRDPWGFGINAFYPAVAPDDTPVYYRLTPDVFAWLRRQVEAADARAAAGDEAVAEWLRGRAGVWVVLCDWVAAACPAEELAAAKPRLPALRVKAEAVPA